MVEKIKLFAWFTILVFAIFLVVSFLVKNYEFVYYSVLLIPLIFVIYKVHKRIHLNFLMFVLVAVFFTLHLLGGLLHISGSRLYDLVFFDLVTYDNLIHFFGSFILVFVSYNLVHKEIPINRLSLFTWGALLVLMSLGFGVIAEFVEFSSVLLFNAPAAARDYFNNSMDLIINLIGAIVASGIIIFYHKKKLFRELVD